MGKTSRLEKSPDWKMSITPEDVLELTEPTEGYLCPMSANIYNIDFVSFKIRDMENNDTLFEVSKDPDQPPIDYALLDDMDDSVRSIRYDFDASFLSKKTIGTTLLFSVGEKEVSNFRMIERHYFGDKLVRSFDFNFCFCMPNSTNSWEAMYDLPELSEEEIREMINRPYETKSDSFYFVNDELIMHNKAEYAYREA